MADEDKDKTREYLRRQQAQAQEIDQAAMQARHGGGDAGGSLISGIIGLITGVIGGILGFFLFFLRKPKYLVLLMVLGAVGAGVAFIAPNVPLQILRNEAVEAHQQGNHQSAFAKFGEYLRSSPGDAEAMYLASLSAMELNRAAEARPLLEKLVHTNEYRADATVNYYLALVSLDDAEKAANILNKTANSPNRPAAAKLLRGFLLALSGDMNRARDDLLDADTQSRSDPAGNEKQLRQLDAQLRKSGLAVADYTLPAAPFTNPAESWDGDFGLPVAHRGFINSYAGVGLDESTLGAEQPESPAIVGAYYALALVINREFEDARKVLEDLGEVYGDREESALDALYALLHLQEGDYEKASERFERLAKNNPGVKELQLNLANSKWNAAPSFSDGNGGEVLELYDQILAKFPGDMAIENNKAVLQIARGEYRTATRILEKLLENAEAPPQAAFNMMALLAQTGSATKADEMLAAAVAAAKANTEKQQDETLPFIAAKIAHRLGKIDDAEKALANLPRDDRASALVIARYLIDNGLLLRAQEKLALVINAGYGEGYYLSGVIAARLGDGEKLRRYAAALEKLGGESEHFKLALQALAAEGEEAGEAFAAALEKSPSDLRRAAFVNHFGFDFILAHPAAREEVMKYSRNLRFSGYPGVSPLLARLVVGSSAPRAQQFLRGASKPLFTWQELYNAGATHLLLKEEAKGRKFLAAAREKHPTNMAILELIASNLEGKPRQLILNSVKYLKAVEAGKGPVSVYVRQISLPSDKRLRQLALASLQDPGNRSALRRTLARYDKVFKETKDRARLVTLHYSRGSFLASIGRTGLALEDLELAVNEGLRDIDDEEVLLGEVLLEAREYDKAVAIFRRKERDVPAPLYRRMLAEAYFAKHDLPAAQKAAALGVRFYPADIRMYITWAKILAAQNQTDRAIATLRAALRTNPNMPDVYKELSDLQARAAYEGAKANRNIYNRLARAEERAKKEAAAKKAGADKKA